MKITKSWFYKSSELISKEVIILDKLNITIFDDDNSLEKVLVWKNSFLNYFSYFKKPDSYLKHFITSWEGAEVVINSLLFSKSNEIKANIIWEIASNKSKIDISIICLAANNSFIDLDWQIQINESLEWVEGYLVEDNVFLWDKAKIRWLPTLLVRSDDVKASHACRIEKISDEKLFYLRSRGILKDNALNMMIESYVVKIFWNLKELDKVFYKEIIENILKEIN